MRTDHKKMHTRKEKVCTSRMVTYISICQKCPSKERKDAVSWNSVQRTLRGNVPKERMSAESASRQ